MKRFFRRLRKLDWATLTPEQRRLLLTIKKKHERYAKLSLPREK